MGKPNFFIIGAPKCGTTSLASWLAKHPRVYMSPVKEPHHFNTDLNYVLTVKRSEYEALFNGANEKHKAIGEASVWYLYSRDAVPNIEAYTNSKARYIVCLRNPIEMAYSLHEEQVFSGKEHIEDFTKAWFMQEKRLSGEAATPNCGDPRLLLYGEASKLGRQIQNLYKIVPKERIHVILLDDLKSNPRLEYLKVLQFLNLEDDGRMHFPVRNRAKGKSRFLQASFRTAANLKKMFNVKRGFGIMDRFAQVVNRKYSRPPLSDEMRQLLREYFREDVMILSELLGRDLSYWLK